MYNGIGLPTPRGSGTNGYVQRNFAFITNTKEKQLYKTEDDFSKVDSRNALFKEPNKDILLHERKRKIESKCLELCKNMEDQGYNDEEIQEKVSSYRRLLLNQLEDSNAPKIDILPETEVPCNRKGTHEMSELNKVKNFIFKEALGISEDFRDGTSMEVAQLRRKEAELSKKLLEAQKEMAILDSSEEEETSLVVKKKKKKHKKRRHKRDRSASVESSDDSSMRKCHKKKSH